MKNLLLSLTLSLVVGVASAQVAIDTVYLDSKFEKTLKGNHEYYQTIAKNSQGLYDIKCYWHSGEIQMTGKVSSLEPLNKQGQFIYYHKGGALSQLVNFKNNQPVGKVKRFAPSGKFDFEYVAGPEYLDNADAFRAKTMDFVRFALTAISYPESELNKDADGRVVVNFYVGENGKVFRPTVVTSASEAFDAEVKYAVASYNKWPTPIYKGEKTLVEITFPIIFEAR